MKLMKMSYNNKKGKQRLLTMLNKQVNNAFLQSIKENETVLKLGMDIFQHIHIQHIYRYK